MAILQIIKDDDPTLRKTSREVTEITPRILTLLDDMAETMRHANGAGLAAVQVGVLRRVVVIECTPGELIELINPKITSQKGEQRDYEGCLSIPGKYGMTVRPQSVTVEALDRSGKLRKYTGSGMLAKAFCHEIDQLDGILYTDKAIKMLSDAELRELFEDDER